MKKKIAEFSFHFLYSVDVEQKKKENRKTQGVQPVTAVSRENVREKSIKIYDIIFNIVTMSSSGLFSKAAFV